MLVPPPFHNRKDGHEAVLFVSRNNAGQPSIVFVVTLTVIPIVAVVALIALTIVAVPVIAIIALTIVPVIPIVAIIRWFLGGTVRLTGGIATVAGMDWGRVVFADALALTVTQIDAII